MLVIRPVACDRAHDQLLCALPTPDNAAAVGAGPQRRDTLVARSAYALGDGIAI